MIYTYGKYIYIYLFIYSIIVLYQMQSKYHNREHCSNGVLFKKLVSSKLLDTKCKPTELKLSIIFWVYKAYR